MADGSHGTQTGAGGGRRRRASHSLQAVLDASVALLDEGGQSALTFRALAARLGGGVGSIYWYVSSREELLDRAADHVMTELLDLVDEQDEQQRAARGPEDPIAELRRLAIALFEIIREHPWTGAYLMRDIAVQPHALGMYERLGRPVLRLDLTDTQAFHAVSAVMGFAVGTAIDLGRQAPPQVVDGDRIGPDYLLQYAEQWRDLDRERFPFIHRIVDVFAHHDDAVQFRAGLDLLLAGLQQQADGQQADGKQADGN